MVSIAVECCYLEPVNSARANSQRCLVAPMLSAERKLLLLLLVVLLLVLFFALDGLPT